MSCVSAFLEEWIHRNVHARIQNLVSKQHNVDYMAFPGRFQKKVELILDICSSLFGGAHFRNRTEMLRMFRNSRRLSICLCATSNGSINNLRRLLLIFLTTQTTLSLFQNVLTTPYLKCVSAVFEIIRGRDSC
jgi:hypothetical protein